MSHGAGSGPRKATILQLVFMTYAVICSGPYGLEEMVSASGPGLTMLVLLVLPVVYAAPISLACAELSARFPIEGGYYRWVRMAFGDFVGYTAAWLVWLTMFATNAAFAVLFSNYLRYFVPDLSPTAHFWVAVALVWMGVAFNYRGISLVGSASVVLTVLIFIPFLLLTLFGLLKWRMSPFVPFIPPGKPLGLALSDGFLIAMWLYGGFEKMTVSAEEVEDPARAFLIQRLSRFYDFQGLFRWKRKFNPEFEDRYLIYPHALALPRIALALVRAQSPGGLRSYFRREEPNGREGHGSGGASEPATAGDAA